MTTQTVRGVLAAERRTYTIHEIAPWLGISVNHAYLLANEKPPAFPVLRLGKRLIIPAAAFDRWLESGGKGEA